jgi:hypothetical protein
MSTYSGGRPPQKPSGGCAGPPPTCKPSIDARPWIVTCSVALTSPSLVALPVIVPTIVIGTAAILFLFFLLLVVFV